MWIKMLVSIGFASSVFAGESLLEKIKLQQLREKEAPSVSSALKKNGWRTYSKAPFLAGTEILVNSKMFHERAVVLSQVVQLTPDMFSSKIEKAFAHYCQDKKQHWDAKLEKGGCWWHEVRKSKKENLELHHFVSFKSSRPGSKVIHIQQTQIKLDHLELTKAANPVGRKIASTLGVAP